MMRWITPFNRCALLIALLAVSASLWAEPIAFGVNSRGNETDSQRVNALWKVHLLTGQAEYVGWTSYLDLEALAFDADGTLFGADDDSNTLVRVSQVTGLAIPVGGIGNRNNMGFPLSEQFDFGMSFDCQGEAFVVSDVQSSLFAADMESGRLTRIGEAGSLGAPITDIAIWGDHVFGIGVGSNRDGSQAAPNLYRIDLEAASAELIGPLGSDVSPYNNAGLAFDEHGFLWAITDRRAVAGGDFPSEILRIDPATGRAEKVAETIVGIESLAIAPTSGCEGRGLPMSEIPAVPFLSLPGLGLLLLLVLASAVVQMRRRQS
jgi:hypothetical protein